MFDERDVFLFDINNMLNLESNIPSKIFYASIGSEILHIVLATTDLVNMVKRVNLLLIRMKKQVSECTRIISLFKKVFGKHFKVFHKFANTADEFIMPFSLWLFFCISLHIFMCICMYIPCYTNIKWYINQRKFRSFNVNLSPANKCSG